MCETKDNIQKKKTLIFDKYFQCKGGVMSRLVHQNQLQESDHKTNPKSHANGDDAL